MNQLGIEDLPELYKDVPEEFKDEVIEKSVAMISHPAFGEA